MKKQQSGKVSHPSLAYPQSDRCSSRNVSPKTSTRLWERLLRESARAIFLNRRFVFEALEFSRSAQKNRLEHFLLEKLIPVPDETFAFVARWRLVLKVFVASDGLDQIFGEVLKKSKLKDFELKS